MLELDGPRADISFWWSFGFDVHLTNSRLSGQNVESTPLAESAAADDFRQHLLDLDRNPVAIDQHDTRRNRQCVGEDLDFVRLGGVEFDDGATAQPHDLMNRHRRGSKHHHEVDADFIEGWHRTDYHTDKSKIAYSKITTLWLADG